MRRAIQIDVFTFFTFTTLSSSIGHIDHIRVRKGVCLPYQVDVVPRCLNQFTPSPSTPVRLPITAAGLDLFHLSIFLAGQN